MKFPSAQFQAIVREKENDRATPVALIPSRITELQGKEKSLNDLYWSLWHKGKCEDNLLSEFFKHERNALRVRIMRLDKRMRNG